MRFHPTITFEQYRDTWLAVAEANPKRARARTWTTNLAVMILCLVVAVLPQISAARVPALAIAALLAFCMIFSKPLEGVM